ncbi:MAG: type II secretion system protein [Deltaproteobacteria bacterium]|nr:type II secretion system protein [Deltaproteobacteria bacterium]
MAYKVRSVHYSRKQAALRRSSAFTMFEFLVVLVVTSIVAYLAIPMFGQINSSMERVNVRKFLLLDLRRAQAESVTHGCRGIFTISSDNRSYSFGCDYLAYDTNVPPSADVITFSRTLPSHTYVTSDRTIIFNSKGQLVDELGFIDSRSITLSDDSDGPMRVFATGSVLGTGLFEYD